MKPGIDPLLAFIHGYQLDHGFPPSVREMRDHLGIVSTNAVFGQLRVRERAGLLSRAQASGGASCRQRTWRVHALGVVR